MTGEVKVKIFGIGKLAEGSVIDSTVALPAALHLQSFIASAALGIAIRVPS